MSLNPRQQRKLAAGMLLAASALIWHGVAHSQSPAAKQTVPAPDPLAEWQYPGAKVYQASNRERVAAITLQGLHCKTTDPLETVYLFYRKKAEPYFAVNASTQWQPQSQFTMLMTQDAQGGRSAGFLNPARIDADTALMIVHQPRRTFTVQLSRDPQDKATTDILLVADEH